MTTLTLSASQVEMLRSHGLIITDGQPCALCGDWPEGSEHGFCSRLPHSKYPWQTCDPPGWCAPGTIIEPRTTCPTCHAWPGRSPNFWLEPCPNCKGWRSVSLGRWRVEEALPVAGEHDDPPGDHYVEVTDQGLVLLHTTDGVQRLQPTALDLVLPPVPRQWAIQLTLVE